MSKVISFSISDRYLSQVKSLYPSLTDNLAVKKFLTDRLDSSLSSSLDDSLDGILDERTKTLIETWVDGLLDERLDDAVKKSIGELTARLSRLESKLDDNLDERLDDMEPLLKLQREASIASPIPTIEETSPPGLPGLIDGAGDAIESSTPEVSPSPPSPALEAIASIDGTIETVASAIELTNKEKAAILGIHASNLTKWIKKQEIPDKYLIKCQFNENKSKIILI